MIEVVVGCSSVGGSKTGEELKKRTHGPKLALWQKLKGEEFQGCLIGLFTVVSSEVELLFVASSWVVGCNWLSCAAARGVLFVGELKQRIADIRVEAN